LAGGFLYAASDPGAFHGGNPPGFPAPTELVRQKDARREMRREREAWIESLHLAAPGTDWRAVERVTRRTQILEREALVRQGRFTTSWTELGSANQAGRTHASAVSPTTGAVYIGSALGGVWKGTPDGSSWQPISDGLGLGSHALVVAPGPPEVITTLTDDGLVHASTNDGLSWFVPDGLPVTTYECARIVRDLGAPNTVYLLVRGLGWVDGDLVHRWFVLRSENGGESYETAHVEPAAPGCDLWIDRANPGPLYLISGGTLKKSTDHGSTFLRVGSASASPTRVVLTGSEAGAPTFYAAFQIGGDWQLWRSTDGGTTWHMRNTIHDWWNTLCASITNPDLVLFAGVECWRSTNGGGTFAKVNNWWDYYGDPENRLHADFPGMECVMIDGQETFFLDTDGGTYTSVDGVATVHNISLHGLGISQYYSILTSRNDPFLVAAGSQDQGYQQSLPETAPYLAFDQLISGDYGHLTSTVRDHNLLYSVYPGFVLIQRNEAAPQGLVQEDFPAGASYSWMPNILADPRDPEVFYLCADHLWKYERAAPANWSMTELPQDFTVAGGSYLTALAISPADDRYWYAATNTGRLWYSHDGGASWSVSGTTGPSAHYFYGTDILPSPVDPFTAYVGGSGYSGPPVYATTDGGVSWQPMAQGLPSTLVFDLAFDGTTHRRLFAAAEAGPFAHDTESGEWASILGTEAPLTVYWCVEGVPELGVVRFGTYGRGIWDYDTGEVVAIGDPDDPVEPMPAPRVHPDPAGAATAITFKTARSGQVSVEVFDVAGRRVAIPFDGTLPAGSHDVRFDLDGRDGRPLGDGVYLVRVSTPHGAGVSKVRVLR
jgi:hypothetical protein